MDPQFSTTRLPMNRSKTNAEMHKQTDNNNKRRSKSDNRQQHQSPSIELKSGDGLISAFVPPKSKEHKDHKGKTSRIPRATPPPVDIDNAFSTTKPKKTSKKSRIPAPSPIAFATPSQQPSQHAAAQPPLGFQFFSNPSFGYPSPEATPVHDDHESTPTSFQPHLTLPQSIHNSRLATPEAMNILDHVLVNQQHQNNTNAAIDRPATNVRGIMNAYLRTGPHKLSPEPSKEYDIAAPNPTIAAATTTAHITEETSHNPADAATFIQVPAVANELLRTRTDHISPEPVGYDVAPRGVCGKYVAASAADAETRDGVATPKSSSPLLQRNDDSGPLNLVSSVCSNIPCGIAVNDDDVENDDETNNGTEQRHSHRYNTMKNENRAVVNEILLAPAVDNHPEHHRHNAINNNNINNNNNNNNVPKKVVQTGILRRGGSAIKKQVRIVSPVAFKMAPEDDNDSNTSAGSFSFGMGFAGTSNNEKHKNKKKNNKGKKMNNNSRGVIPPAHPSNEEDPTPQTIMPCLVNKNKITEKHTLVEAESSGDSIGQPNPFASMLNHLREGGPAALVSPAGDAFHMMAPWEEDAGANCSGVAAVAQAVEAVDSPCSPQNCTPMHLLPERSSTVMVSVTPELGKGNLQAWVDRRGLQDALTSPATADLRRLWNGMRDVALVRHAAEAATAENESLRQDLYVAQQALMQLGEERSAAVNAAEAGKQWAMAELARAQYVAQHMMSLAHQIQATFMMCEQEKAVLAQQLEEARHAAEEAHNEAFLASEEAAACEEELQEALALQEEVEVARQIAQQAQHDAAVAKQAAATAAAELSAIKIRLEQAQKELNDASNSKNAGEIDVNTFAHGKNTISSLQAQLHAVHNALTSLHSENRVSAAQTSPQLQRLFTSCAQGLGDAKDFLDGTDIEPLPPSSKTLVGVSHKKTTVDVEIPQQSHADHHHHGSRVQSMVDFFETIAIGQRDDLKSNDGCGDAINEEDDDEEVVVGAYDFSIQDDGDIIDAHPDFIEEDLDEDIDIDDFHGDDDDNNNDNDDRQRFASYLPHGTPLGNNNNNNQQRCHHHQRKSHIDGTTPQAPKCTPANNATPCMQRRHMQTMHAFASLQQRDDAIIDHYTDENHHQVTMTKSNAVLFGDQQETSLISPLDIEALQHASRSGLQNEVRNRLQKLKGELQTARDKLNNVDKGLAAIATTPTAVSRTPSTAGKSASRPPLLLTLATRENSIESVFRPCSSEEHSDQPSPAHATPLNCTHHTDLKMTPKTRHSVRFADSVKPASPLQESSMAVDDGILEYPLHITESVSPWMRMFDVEDDDDEYYTNASRYGSTSIATTNNNGTNNNGTRLVMTPQRQLYINDSSDDDDDDKKVLFTNASSRIGMRMNTTTPISFNNNNNTALTPVGKERRDLINSTARMTSIMHSPALSRHSSSSVSSFSPNTAAILSIRPLVTASGFGGGASRFRGRNGGVNGLQRGSRKPSDSEEKEFRRRAAALKIHVSPYFNRKSGQRSALSSP